MLEFRPENFRHACESGDHEAQLYAFWAHSRTGLAAARSGDAATVDSCARALTAMVDFFSDLPIAGQASAAIARMEASLGQSLGGADEIEMDRYAFDGGESA